MWWFFRRRRAGSGETRGKITGCSRSREPARDRNRADPTFCPI